MIRFLVANFTSNPYKQSLLVAAELFPFRGDKGVSDWIHVIRGDPSENLSVLGEG